MQASEMTIAAANYLAVTTLVSLLLCGVYCAALRGLTFFRLNRAILLMIPAVSLSIPIIAPGVEAPGIPLPEGIQSVRIISAAPEPGFAGRSEPAAEAPSPKAVISGDNSDKWLAAAGIYLLGAVFMLVNAACGLSRIMLLKKIARPAVFMGENVLIVDRNIGSFSFMRTVFLSERLADAEGAGQILRHELQHAKGLHSLDLMAISCLKILFWFNPAFYVIERELRNVHEYIADSCAARDKKKYMEALLESTFGCPMAKFVSSFYSTNILKRIRMLRKHKSGRLAMAGYALLLPCLLFCLFIASCNKAGNGGITGKTMHHNYTLDNVVMSSLGYTQTDTVEKQYYARTKDTVWAYRPPVVCAEPVIEKGGWQEFYNKYYGQALMTPGARKAGIKAVQINLSLEVRADGTPAKYCYVTGVDDSMNYRREGIGYGLDSAAMNALMSVRKGRPALDSNNHPIATRVWVPIVIGDVDAFNARFRALH